MKNTVYGPDRGNLPARRLWLKVGGDLAFRDVEVAREAAAGDGVGLYFLDKLGDGAGLPVQEGTGGRGSA